MPPLAPAASYRAGGFFVKPRIRFDYRETIWWDTDLGLHIDHRETQNMSMPQCSFRAILIITLALAMTATLSCRAMLAPSSEAPSGPGAETLESVDDAFTSIDHSNRPAPSPSRGCSIPSSHSTGQTHERSIRHDGLERYARVFIPSIHSHERPAPLVFMLHGGLGSGEQLEMRSAEMNTIAEREGFIVLYPDGVESDGLLKARTWNAGGCCGYAHESDADDVGFLIALLDEISDQLCVDARRVYSAGMSNGAMMSYRLACEHAPRFAAIAPVAAGQIFPTCDPSNSVPVLHIHGSDDPNAPYVGGQGCGLAGVSFPPVMEGLDLWRGTNACQGPERHLLALGNGRCELLGECEAPVVRCLVEGGGHSWHGGHPPALKLRRCEGGSHSTSFPSSELIWRFFSGQARDL